MRKLAFVFLASWLSLIGCGADTPQVAGGSSDQGNALHLTLATREGMPASGIMVEIHSRDWLQGTSMDPAAQALRTDSLGTVTIPSPRGLRLVARIGSIGTWADLDSLKAHRDTLTLQPTAKITGRITGSTPGSYLAIRGTGITAGLDETGSFELSVPAGLGTLSLVSGTEGVTLPPIATPSGTTTTLAPVEATTASNAPILGLSSQWLPINLTLRTAKVLRSQDTSFLRIEPGDWVSLGPVIPDSTAEGTVSFAFRPGDAFHRDSAWTILGDQGGRLHIAFIKGTLFFQKGQDNLHRIVTSTSGQLPTNRWYRISASWGSMGMSLSVDGKPVAWSSDSSGYRRDTRTDTGFHISIGHKEYCCMDVLRITRPLQGAGDYADIRFLRKPLDVWGDGSSRKCPESLTTDLLPRCVVQGAVYVTDPLW